MRHDAEGASRGSVLMIPPLPPERVPSSVPWTGFARHLARAGHDVLRFDPRGVGESTGPFSLYSLASLIEDADHIASFADSGPLVLFGLRFGALAAAELFARGIGDAMLLWSPPVSARAALFDALRLRVATDLTVPGPGPKKTREDYVAELEAGQAVEVEGYALPPALWREAATQPLAVPPQSETRPWHALLLGREKPEELGLPEGHTAAAPVPRPPFWARSPLLDPALGPLFAGSTQWLERALCTESSR